MDKIDPEIIEIIESIKNYKGTATEKQSKQYELEKVAKTLVKFMEDQDFSECVISIKDEKIDIVAKESPKPITVTVVVK